jgi:hypothetical protein
MIPSAELETDRLPTTDGEIALINLESARRRSWSRFLTDPHREGLAEAVVEHEQLTAQFVGDVCALDRLESLANSLVGALPSSHPHSVDPSASCVSNASFCRGEAVSGASGDWRRTK